MFNKVGLFIFNWANSINPWTNVYGLSRSLIALSAAMTLAFNNASILFRPAAGVEEYPQCSNTISYFCLFPNDYGYLDMSRWIAIGLLLVIASGWRPRYTGILHWWISYSFNISAITVDGGEQVSSVLTFLLIPITLTDPRKWHWQSPIQRASIQQDIPLRIIALVTIVFIRIQVSIIYLHSSVAKMFEPTWINGTSIYYFFNDPMLGLPELLYKAMKPILTSPLIVIPVWGTLILQMFLFAALLSPKKYWKYFLITALLLHELIAVMLGLISFSIVMIAALILYLRPVEMEFRLLSGLLKKGKYRKADHTLPTTQLDGLRLLTINKEQKNLEKLDTPIDR